MTVGATGSTTSSTGTTATDSSPKTGFAALDSTAFMKMLIVQLQNQDPTEPMTNSELLNQLTSMQSLTSNTELTSAIKSLTSSQQLSSAASYIGRAIVGQTDDNQAVGGTVDRALLRDGKAYLGIGDVEVPLSKVLEVG